MHCRAVQIIALQSCVVLYKTVQNIVVQHSGISILHNIVVHHSAVIVDRGVVLLSDWVNIGPGLFWLVKRLRFQEI